jgi:hypothetical protein
VTPLPLPLLLLLVPLPTLDDDNTGDDEAPLIAALDAPTDDDVCAPAVDAANVTDNGNNVDPDEPSFNSTFLLAIGDGNDTGPTSCEKRPIAGQWQQHST